VRFAIIYRPKNPPPPEAMPQMFQRLEGWMGRYRDRMQVFEFFVGGGGIGVIDVDDTTELQRMIAEHPFTPFAEVEIRPTVDPDTALRTLKEAYSAAVPS